MTNPDELFRRLRERRVLVLGDVMLDRFVWGDVSRISPEAPVPVVHIAKERDYPGGAANVARNVVPYAAGASIIGRIGRDADGALLRQRLEDEGIGTELLIESDHCPTTVKTRFIARHQHVLRVDREKCEPVTGDERERLLAGLEAHLGDYHALVLEDYAKGLFTQELVDGIRELTMDRGIVTAVDPNPGNRIDWSGFTLVKPNRLEAFRELGFPDPGPSGATPLEDGALAEAGRLLLERWSPEHLLITLGEQGMILFSRDGTVRHVATRAKEVYDVSGAGDTVIAFVALALAAGLPAFEAAEIANAASGIVVGKLGTSRPEAGELAEALAGIEL